jgi:hypothetical protein
MIRNVEMMHLVCHVTCDVDVETMQPDSPKKQQQKEQLRGYGAHQSIPRDVCGRFTHPRVALQANATESIGLF